MSSGLVCRCGSSIHPNFAKRVRCSVFGYLLFGYIIFYFAASMFWRSYIIWRKTGVNPYALGGSDDVYDFVGRLFWVTLLACFLNVVLYTFWPAAYAVLTPIPWLSAPLFDVLGAFLLVASLVWVLVA